MEHTPEELVSNLMPANKSFSLHIDLDHLDIQYRSNITSGSTWQLVYQRELVEIMLKAIGYKFGKYDERDRAYRLHKVDE